MIYRLQKFSMLLFITPILYFLLPTSSYSQFDSTLTTLDYFPGSNEIFNVELIPDINQSTKLNPELFKELIDSATIVSSEDPILKEWHYAPWYRGKFSTKDGVYKFILYLGGLGVLKTPEGLKGAFRLNINRLDE